VSQIPRAATSLDDANARQSQAGRIPGCAANSPTIRCIEVSRVELIAREESIKFDCAVCGIAFTKWQYPKPFKRAKKFLGIRSVRNGFGSAGEWFWLLEKQPTLTLVVEPPREVAPRIPSGWIDGVARLGQRRPPPDIPPHRWRQFMTDCTKFLASPGGWAERAAALGWDAVVLFGCCRHRPLDRPGISVCFGAINGGRLVELHRDWAVFELAENRGAFLSVGVLTQRTSGCPGLAPEATSWRQATKALWPPIPQVT
jgi:hypothetical protein